MATIRPSTTSDLGAILTLLNEAALLTVGVEGHLAGFLVAVDGDRVVGSAGLEHYGDIALLRSVVVDPAFRGSGLGVRLVSAALEEARRRGVQRVTLLTDTAGVFFSKLGFSARTRDDLDPRLLASGLFTDPTCIDALVMTMDLHVVAGTGAGSRGEARYEEETR